MSVSFSLQLQGLTTLSGLNYPAKLLVILRRRAKHWGPAPVSKSLPRHFPVAPLLLPANAMLANPSRASRLLPAGLLVVSALALARIAVNNGKTYGGSGSGTLPDTICAPWLTRTHCLRSCRLPCTRCCRLQARTSTALTRSLPCGISSDRLPGATSVTESIFTTAPFTSTPSLRR